MDEPDPASSWAATEADLLYVLAQATLPAGCARWAAKNLDRNELGVAWQAISRCLSDPTPDVADRMEAARQRMGLPLGDSAQP